MAAPSSSYPHHPAQYGGPPYGHPAVGGKGIPMHVPAPVYDPSSPAPSSPSVASSSRYAHQPGLAGGPPDLTGACGLSSICEPYVDLTRRAERYRLKAKYLKLQKKYFRSLEASRAHSHSCSPVLTLQTSKDPQGPHSRAGGEGREGPAAAGRSRVRLSLLFLRGSPTPD